MNAPLPDENRTLVWQLSHAYTFALPQRESDELTALLMRAARMISSAQELLEKSKVVIDDWSQTDPEEDKALSKDIAGWLEDLR